ncbi:MAG TPA: 50S ribosomal protein L15 [Candidatus Pacebacteria bacterium]|nr:50S ribosomal protein L15 [Candidatus Paceibacterota bacterium]
MKLNTLPPVSEVGKKRLGRGYGSGKGGHTSGRGTKGQRSRTGKGIPLWFEGGARPLIKRLPFIRGKSRFGSIDRKPQLVTLAELNALKEKEITPEVLFAHKLIHNVHLSVKIVGKGELKNTYVLHNIRASGPAKALIEKAGGTLD